MRKYRFLPAPGGQWALLSTDKGIYRLEHGSGEDGSAGWTKRVLLGKEVNANGTQMGPDVIGADGSFVFSRDAGNRESGELFIAYPGTRPAATTSTCFPFPGRADARE